ncbi:LysM peptidoglycan-binding domain-containing protein [Demequina sp. SO4-18]|uniref:LysM peptidoglycan-binding domain-containing protein n=1 Tax=Demequina sp. SO4-18 TaxID=3401026 RepID=UPI003B59B4FE
MPIVRDATSTQPRGERTARAARRAAAWSTVLAMPPLALAFAHVTWEAGLLLAHDIEGAPTVALSTVTMADLLTVAAGAGGTAAAAYLSLASLLVFATPRGSRARSAAMRLMPATWRRIVSVAASGALATALAVPATAAPDSSDAGWVPQPIAPGEAITRPLLAPILPAPEPQRPAHTPAPPRDEPTRSAAAHPTHTAGEGAAGDEQDAGDETTYTVMAGDSLWTIAADALEGGLGDGESSQDDAKTAAAWPDLFDANRETIGDDPALIHPGQELVLPERWTR